MFFEPVREGFDSIPVLLDVGIVGDNQGCDLDFVRFKMTEQFILDVLTRDTVVSDQGIGESENLAFIAWIS